MNSIRGLLLNQTAWCTRSYLARFTSTGTKHAEAGVYLDECLAIARAIGSDDHLGEHLQTAADLALVQGNLDGACETLHAALRAARAAHAHRQKIKDLLRLARLDVRQNCTAQAQRALAALRAEANLPDDLYAEVDALVQALPATTVSPIRSLDALINEVIKSG